MTRNEYCVVVVSEGARLADGTFLADAGAHDAFGNAQLGGVASVIAELVRSELAYKYHYAIADYLQRSARHIAARVDVEQAYAVGQKAVEFALEGENAIMPTIVREADEPYRWTIGKVALGRVANREKKLPRSFISPSGFSITARCRRYLAPLIGGEDYPPYRDGLPCYATPRNEPVTARLTEYFMLKMTAIPRPIRIRS